MVRVELTQGHCALIDTEDADFVLRYKWKILKSRTSLYACRTHRQTQTILMHREIIGAPPDVFVDHINGNGLDNRRQNLRMATNKQNQFNRKKGAGRSRFKGVYWNAERGKWQTQIGAGLNENGKRRMIYLGRFDSEEEAARAYDRKAMELIGEFARLNFPTHFVEPPDIAEELRKQGWNGPAEPR